jgi:hypothetical protein
MISSRLTLIQDKAKQLIGIVVYRPKGSDFFKIPCGLDPLLLGQFFQREMFPSGFQSRGFHRIDFLD